MCPTIKSPRDRATALVFECKQIREGEGFAADCGVAKNQREFDDSREVVEK